MLTPDQETALRRLAVSWSIRAQPGAPGQQTDLMTTNLRALEAALLEIKTHRTRVALFRPLVGQLRRRLVHKLRARKPVSYTDIAVLDAVLDSTEGTI